MLSKYLKFTICCEVSSVHRYDYLSFVFVFRDHAKLLWQRIPEEVRLSCPVLGQLWDIGKQLWKKDFPAVYRLVRSVTWPDVVAPLVASLVGKGASLVHNNSIG